MVDSKIIAELNAGYRLPADAGPAWRAAYEAGEDMSLLECNLSLTPEQRIEQHQRALDLALAIREASPFYAAE
jgi:hypothetical protein